MRRWMCCALSAMLLWALPACAGDTAISISVSPTTAQTFNGFGASLLNTNDDYQQLSPQAKSNLTRLLWPGINLKMLRLWFSPATYDANPANPDFSDFKRHYIDSGLIAAAQQGGNTTLLLAPADVPASFTTGAVGTDGFPVFSDAGVAAYAKLLASFIKQVQNTTGVTINATGVLNEPNDRPIRFTLVQWPIMIRDLRHELNSRGLASTQIVAPEAASCDDTALGMINAMKQDPLAWKALGGIATHTYNMGASDILAPALAGQAKAYWQTESSDPGPQDPADPLPAAACAARIIGDLNHRVTHWIWFLGFEQTDPNDNGTRLVSFDSRLPDGAITPYSPYYAMQQLSATFPPGTVIVPCTSSLEGSMTFTYGHKPTLLATAGRDPSGNLVVALVNYTSDAFSSALLSDWDRSQGGLPAQTIHVTVTLPGMTGFMGFAATQTDATHHNASVANVIATAGVMNVTLLPMEVLTLKSQGVPRLGGGGFTPAVK